MSRSKFISINRKKSVHFNRDSRVFGEFDGEDGHVVGWFVVCDPSEGGGENVLRESLRVERTQGAKIRAQVGRGGKRRRHAVAHKDEEVPRAHGHAHGRGADGLQHADGQRLAL